MAVIVMGGDNVEWDGWEASINDLPRLVQRYQTKSAIVQSPKGSIMDYDDAQKVADALHSAGVSNVQLATGGTADQ